MGGAAGLGERLLLAYVVILLSVERLLLLGGDEGRIFGSARTRTIASADFTLQVNQQFWVLTRKP